MTNNFIGQDLKDDPIYQDRLAKGQVKMAVKEEAQKALKTGGSVYELVMKKGLLSREQLDDLLRPENMTDPREIPQK